MIFNKRVALSIFLATISCSIVAAEVSDIERYSNAKVEIKYKGEIGDLAQKLAQKLEIGYYAYQADSSMKVDVQQDNSRSLEDLFSALNSQLKKENIRFDILNDKVTLVLAGNSVKELNNPSYIGQVVFDSTVKTELLSSEATETDKEVIEVVKPEDLNKATSEQSNLQQSDGKVSSTLDQEKVNAANKIQSILDVSKDKNLIAQYSRRKQPAYSVDNKEQVKLDAVRSTKISTFLVFEQGVDLKDYKIEGEFQDFAKLDNVAAILHRQKSPPSFIMITAPDGRKAKLSLSN